MALLEANGASKECGAVIVPEHINKIKARAMTLLMPRVRACVHAPLR